MKHIILALGGFALAACASSVTEPQAKGVAQYEGDARLGEKADKICFASNIDNFGEATRTTVVMEEGRKEYLVEVFGGCLNLKNAKQIALAARTGCLTKGDRLVTSESFININDDTGLGPQSCLVKGIYDWDSKALADGASATAAE